MSKPVFIGNENEIRAFAAFGVEIFPTKDANETKSALEYILRSGNEYRVIFISRNRYSEISETIDKYAKSVFPLIVPLPTGQVSSNETAFS